MLMIKNVRLSFPSLFEKTAFQDGEPQYSAVFLIEKQSETERAIIAEITRVARDEFGNNAENILNRIRKTNRWLLKDGDEKVNEEGEVYPGYAGMVYLKGGNKKSMRVVNRDRTDLTDADNVIYSGCRVNAQVDIWAQDNTWGKFINCKLLAVQFWADDEPMSGGGGAAADVEAFEFAEPLVRDEIPW